MWVDHVQGETFHGRKGALGNSFRYGVDYLLIDPEAVEGPALFSRNRANLISLHDRDYGGAPGEGRGAAWVREVLAAQGLPPAARILLLTQPRVLGHVFNPVSFWLCEDAAGALRCVVAEVSNTFGDRHWYLCAKPDGSVIERTDTLEAAKIMHVSPFQPIEGGYRFRFDIREGSGGRLDRLQLRRGRALCHAYGPASAAVEPGDPARLPPAALRVAPRAGADPLAGA